MYRNILDYDLSTTMKYLVRRINLKDANYFYRLLEIHETSDN